MCGRRRRLGRRLLREPVLAGGEDVLDGVEAAGAEGEGAGAGGVEPGVAVLPPQTHDPQDGSIPLLRMWAALQDAGDELTGCGSDLLGPTDEARRRPLGVGAMGAGHVLGQGGRLPVVASPVRRHAPALEEDLDGRRRIADLDLLAEERKRHAVDVALDDDVIVHVDATQLPVRQDVAVGGQRSERRAVELLVEGEAADAELLHRPVVERVEEDADRPVQGAEAEEGLVAEPGEDPPLHQEYARLDLALVPRLARSRRDDDGAVVGGEVLVGSIDVRLVAAQGRVMALLSSSGTHKVVVPPKYSTMRV